MTAPMSTWLTEPLAPDVAASLRRLREAESVRHVAVMPDVHLAEDVCVGVVVAAADRIFPAAVGGDIGCGVASVRLLAPADALGDESAAARVLHGFGRVVPALLRPGGASVALPDGLEEVPLSDSALETRRRREGRQEFGSLGRGNHFLEIERDDEGALWLTVHSGSRAMGGAIRDHHLHRCGVDESTGLAWLHPESDEGRAYLADHAWALAYADANRRAVLAAATEVLATTIGATADVSSVVACHHNHVRAESHFGETLWVHRKGAIPAGEGESGVVPGSMGGATYHTLGRGCADALRSSSHGAGRVMSRSEARRRVSVRELERSLRGVWWDHRLAARLREEAPAAYRDPGRVMRAQRDLTRIARRLEPVLAYKGS